jgi:DNA-binding beta-propeller fold protein YncE
MIRVPSSVVPALRRLAPAVLLLAAAARSQEFEPNALAVIDLDTPALRLLDGGGGLIEELDTEFSLGSVFGAAFGPNGHLYVASYSGGAVYELDRQGNFVSIIGLGVLGDPTDVAVGPDGELYVSDYAADRICVFSPGGVLQDEIGAGSPLDQPEGLAVFPGGILAVGNGATNTVLRFTTDGAYLDEVGATAGIGDIMGIDWPRDAPIYVADFDNDRVLAFGGGDEVLFTLGADGELDGPSDVVVGPDGLIWVLVYAMDNTLVRRLDVGALGGTWPSALAIAPHRFHVKLSGPLGLADADAELHKELDATLVALPGRGTAWLQLEDDPQDDGDLASVFGTTLLSFAGAEHELLGGKQCHWLGFHDGATDFDGLQPTLGLRWKCGTDTAGVQLLRSARGTLHIGAGSTSCVATVRTAGLVK